MSPRWGRGLGPVWGWNWAGSGGFPGGRTEAVPLPGLGWGCAGVRAVAAGPGTQRALLLLPDPIIPSPILSEGLGVGQEELRQLRPCSPPPLGRWAVPPRGPAGIPGTAQGVLEALLGFTPGCTFGILLFSPSCLSVLGWAGAALRGHPGRGTSPATIPRSWVTSLVGLRAGAAPNSHLQLLLWLFCHFSDHFLIGAFTFPSRGKHLGPGPLQKPPRSCPLWCSNPPGSSSMKLRDEGGSWGIFQGGFFCSLFEFISTELSMELFSPLPTIPANPNDVLFPSDDHGAVQPQPQEFHFYGQDLRKSLSK